MLPAWLSRVLSLSQRDSSESELEEELRLHLRDRADDLERSGLPRAEAERRARLEFGGYQKFKEECREALGATALESWLQDIRFALRMLRKNPGLTLVAVASLALGIGANTAVFRVVNTVLLSRLPYSEPDQLVKIWGRFSKEGIPQNSISEPEWWDMGDRLHSFATMAAYSAGDGANFSRDGSEPVRIVTAESTSALWSVLRVTPILGRPYSASDDQPGHDHVALLSYGLWSRQFASDPDIVGKSLQLDAETYTVIGVLPKGFAFAGHNDLWLPLGLDRAHGRDRGSHYLEVIGRLRPGLTLGGEAAELDGLAAQLALEYPDFYGPQKGFGLSVVPLHVELIANRRTALLVAFGAVTLVLLIACANLANLLLARSSTRSREIALRLALGARRSRIVRQLLTESVLISALGGLAGVALSLWGVPVFRALTPAFAPETSNAALNAPVLLFALGISFTTGVLFGLAPALQLSKPGLQNPLNDAGRSSTGMAGQRLRNTLVVAEIAMTLVLLLSAGLLVRSLERLLEVSPGFQPDQLLAARVTIPTAKYPDGVSLALFFRSLVERVRTLPGVEAAGATSLIPMAERHASGSTYAEHTSLRDAPISEWAHVPYIEADRRFVTAGYLEAIKIPLFRGRLFTDADNENAPPVAIVDTELARRFWPGENPLGQRIATGAIPGTNPPIPKWRTVVGVVGHIHNDTLDQVGREQAYFPQSQVTYVRSMYLVVRTSLGPTALAGSIRAELASLDPTIPLYALETVNEQIAQTTSAARFNMLLLTSFAVLSLLLAAVGTYGVLSYAVSQRTREIGIRMALGASPREVLAMVVRNACRLAAIGIALGGAAALALTRAMASLLFGVSATDPLAFGAAIVLLMSVTLLAAYVPARRAMRVDPMIALRYE